MRASAIFFGISLVTPLLAIMLLVLRIDIGVPHSPGYKIVTLITASSPCSTLLAVGLLRTRKDHFSVYAVILGIIGSAITSLLIAGQLNITVLP